jgi:twitching motility two-component system response regulator PilH
MPSSILIIDDSPFEIRQFASVFEKKGFKVLTAENAQEGIQIAKDNKPDVIIMDVVMPGMNGFQATRQLHKNQETSEIPIIIVTTKDLEADISWGKRQGASDYLTKPVEDKMLLSTVNKILGVS